MLFDRRTIWMIDVIRPRFRVWIWPPAEARKQIEFQMVMAIDQSRENQITIEIQFGLSPLESLG